MNKINKSGYNIKVNVYNSHFHKKTSIKQLKHTRQAMLHNISKYVHLDLKLRDYGIFNK